MTSASCLEVASDLVKNVPESGSAFMTNVEALIGLSRYDDALALADERLKLLTAMLTRCRRRCGSRTSRGNYRCGARLDPETDRSGKRRLRAC